jgi:hypothetical protein
MAASSRPQFRRGPGRIFLAVEWAILFVFTPLAYLALSTVIADLNLFVFFAAPTVYLLAIFIHEQLRVRRVNYATASRAALVAGRTTAMLSLGSPVPLSPSVLVAPTFSAEHSRRPLRLPPLPPLQLRIPFTAAAIGVLSFLLARADFLLPIVGTRDDRVYFLKMLVFYPLVSALPQELCYRVVYFARYAAVFPDQRRLFASNVFAFGFLHVVYLNWYAPFLAAAIGFIFAAEYLERRSWQRLWLEHSCAGMSLFLFGLSTFFTGAGA